MRRKLHDLTEREVAAAVEASAELSGLSAKVEEIRVRMAVLRWSAGILLFGAGWGFLFRDAVRGHLITNLVGLLLVGLFLVLAWWDERRRRRKLEAQHFALWQRVADREGYPLRHDGSLNPYPDA